MENNQSISNSGLVGKEINLTGDSIAGRDINIYHNSTDEEKDVIRCPYCEAKPEVIPEEAKILCQNCGETYYEWRPIMKNVSSFKNLPSEYNQKYGDLIFQIVAKIQLKEYVQAKKKCEEAIDISSRTPDAWEYLTYCYFLTQNWNDILKNRANKILQYIKIIDEINDDSEGLDEIRRTVAFKLHHFIKRKIRYIRNNEKNLDKKKELLSYYINSWKTCYKIYNSPMFLKELVLSFHGHETENWFDYVWSIKEQSFVIVSHISIAKKLDDDLKIIIKQIKSKDRNYNEPQINGGDFEGKLKMPLQKLLLRRQEEKRIYGKNMQLLEDQKVKTEQLKYVDRIVRIVATFAAVVGGVWIIYNNIGLLFAVLIVMGIFGSLFNL